MAQRIVSICSTGLRCGLIASMPEMRCLVRSLEEILMISLLESSAVAWVAISYGRLAKVTR